MRSIHMCMHYTTLLFSAPIRLFLRTSRDSRIPQVALHDANAPVPISQMVYLSQWRMDQPNVDNRRTILIYQGSGIFRKIPRLRNKTGANQKQEQEQKSTITYFIRSSVRSQNYATTSLHLYSLHRQ